MKENIIRIIILAVAIIVEILFNAAIFLLIWNSIAVGTFNAPALTYGQMILVAWAIIMIFSNPIHIDEE